MLVTSVEEPVEIPLHRKGGVNFEAIGVMRDDPPTASTGYGCYRFAAHNARLDRFLPVYVGLAAKQTLAGEALYARTAWSRSSGTFRRTPPPTR